MPHPLRCKTFLWLPLSVPIAWGLALMPVAPAQATTPTPAAIDGMLESALAGEFALQAGLLDQAASHYLRAATLAGQDTVLAERATRLALLADDRPLAGQATALWQALSPHALGARAAQAMLALRNGNPAQALPVLAGLLADPDPAGAATAVVTLAQSGAPPQAVVAVLTALLEGGHLPASPQIWQELGALVLRLEDETLARKMLAAAASLFPDEPRVRLLQARFLHADGLRDQALAVLSPLHAVARGDVQVRNALAAQYEAMGEWALGGRVMAMGPQDTLSLAVRAAFLVKQNDRNQLRALYGRLVRAPVPDDPERHLLLGKMAEYLQQYEQALAWYQRGRPGEAGLEARLRTVMLLHRMGRRSEAVATVQSLQNDVRLDENARRDAYLLESELQSSAGERLRALNRGLAAFALDPALLYARALHWIGVEQAARAEADLRQLLAAEPDNASALNALGYLLADRTTRYQEALELINRALVAEPDNPAVLDSHGWVLYRLGRVAEASGVLRRAWALQRDAEIGAHLAEVLLASGQAAEAREIYEQARAIDPEHRAIQLLHERLGP